MNSIAGEKQDKYNVCTCYRELALCGCCRWWLDAVIILFTWAREMFNQKITINILSMDNFDQMKIIMDINVKVNYQRNFSQNKKKKPLRIH